MEVDCSAGVHQIVAGVVDVDGVVLVGQVPLDLVPRVPVHPELVVHLVHKWSNVIKSDCCAPAPESSSSGPGRT